MNERLHFLRMTQEGNISGVETWIFSCPDCEYRGAYRIDTTNGHRELDILERGNEEAFHYSNHLFSLLMEGFLWERPLRIEEEFDWDSWLNPQIRAELDRILSGLD
jgi:hypothetical protein